MEEAVEEGWEEAEENEEEEQAGCRAGDGGGLSFGGGGHWVAAEVELESFLVGWMGRIRFNVIEQG